ncbi:MAG: hypothetical protein U5K81_05450 [Trueperaceae bacterium]|nr:hypothetical protein [Trueperaceae bacterium]
MTVDEWVFEAVESSGERGATLREIQRWIDDVHGDELAPDTIEASLTALVEAERVRETTDGRYACVPKTDKADALRRLFGE